MGRKCTQSPHSAPEQRVSRNMPITGSFVTGPVTARGTDRFTVPAKTLAWFRRRGGGLPTYPKPRPLEPRIRSIHRLGPRTSEVRGRGPAPVRRRGGGGYLWRRRASPASRQTSRRAVLRARHDVVEVLQPAPRGDASVKGQVPSTGWARDNRLSLSGARRGGGLLPPPAEGPSGCFGNVHGRPRGSINAPGRHPPHRSARAPPSCGAASLHGPRRRPGSPGVPSRSRPSTASASAPMGPPRP